MVHTPTTRPCSAQDLILVTGGVACSNCGASSVPPMTNGCSEITADNKPCPLPADEDGRCWIHNILEKEA